MSNIISIYKKVFHCHKNTQHNTLRFGNKLLPFSGEGVMLSILMTIAKVPVNVLLVLQARNLSCGIAIIFKL
jgi:hypothetical protein